MIHTTLFRLQYKGLFLFNFINLKQLLNILFVAWFVYF